MKHLSNLRDGIKANPWLTVLAVLLDVLFFVLVFASLAITITSIIPQLRIIDELIKTLPQSDDALTAASYYQTLADDPSLLAAFARIKFSIVLFGISACVLWLLIEGVAWFVSQRMLSPGVKFLGYYGKFFLSSVVTIFLFLIGIYLTMFIAWKSIFSFVESIAVVNSGLLVYLVIVSFLGVVLLSSLAQKNNVRHALKSLTMKLPESVIAFSIPVLAMIAAFFILKYTVRINNHSLSGSMVLLICILYSLSRLVWQKEIGEL